jgi:valyl-tRNA synthetase
MQPQMTNAIEKATRRQFPQGIPSYGTDALRYTFAALATMGRDIRFDLGRIEGYRNFCNKLWNAARFVLMNTEPHAAELTGPYELALADRWIRDRLGRTVVAVREHFSAYRFDLAAQAMHQFVWYEFCDWYLELAKPALQSDTASPASRLGTRRTLLTVLEASLRMLHPLMPFVTEEIWQRVAPLAGETGDTIMLAPYPQAAAFPADDDAVPQIEALQAIVLGIRQIRGELDVPHARVTPAWVLSERANDADALASLAPLIARLGNLESVELVRTEAELPPSAIAIVDGRAVLAPFSRLVDDLSAGAARLEKRRTRALADRDRSRARLENAGFVANAPAEVVAVERERLAEFERHAEQLDQQLRRLNALVVGSTA